MLCTKYMASSEVMTSSTRSFAYSYRLVKKCFVKICETSKCHNFLIFQPIFIRFSLFCSQNFTLSSEIKLNLFWSSPLTLVLPRCAFMWYCMAKYLILNLKYKLNISPSKLKTIFFMRALCKTRLHVHVCNNWWIVYNSIMFVGILLISHIWYMLHMKMIFFFEPDWGLFL